jgi:hypothetical protein
MPILPPPAPDERSALLGFLATNRQALRTAAHGLTEQQARATPTASSLSVGGLIKHLTSVERTWMGLVRQAPRPPGSRTAEENFRLADGETLPGVLADYRRATDETDEVIAGIADLGTPVPAPPGVPWFAGVDAWSVRWVLGQLISETARHAGHADIVREAVDGATAMPLLAATEGLPGIPWVTPWRPASAEPGI